VATRKEQLRRLAASRKDPKFVNIIDRFGSVVEPIYGLRAGQISFQSSFWKAINLDEIVIPAGGQILVIGYCQMSLVVIPATRDHYNPMDLPTAVLTTMASQIVSQPSL
jgi:hypothetical protein